MKNLLIVVISLLVLSGCNEKISRTNVSIDPPPIKSPIITNSVDKANVPPTVYLAKSEEFDRVIGWVSETQIMFVEINKEGSHVYTYDLNRHKKTHVITVDMPIIDVKIHPSKTHFALIMSDNSIQATIGIYELEGTKVDEFSIESSEVVFEWHPLNVDQMIVTAFYEDWTFDTFTYSSKTQAMSLISSTQPFLKWSSKNQLVGVDWKENDALSGGHITEISSTDGTISKSDESNFIFVDYFDHLKLTVQIDQENELFIYLLTNMKTGGKKKFETPALSNYSQWFIPEIIWTNKESFITFTSPVPGLLDANQPNLVLEEFNIKTKHQLEVEDGYGQLVCSPSGEECLIGDGLSTLINLSSGEKMKWIEYKSE